MVFRLIVNLRFSRSRHEYFLNLFALIPVCSRVRILAFAMIQFVS